MEKRYTIEEIKYYCKHWLKGGLCTDGLESIPENERLQAVIHYIDLFGDSDSIDEVLRKSGMKDK